MLAELAARVGRAQAFLAEDDIAAWDGLLDRTSPMWLGNRTDLALLTARTIHMGTKPVRWRSDALLRDPLRLDTTARLAHGAPATVGVAGAVCACSYMVAMVTGFLPGIALAPVSLGFLDLGAQPPAPQWGPDAGQVAALRRAGAAGGVEAPR